MRILKTKIVNSQVLSLIKLGDRTEILKLDGKGVYNDITTKELFHLI